MNDNINMDDIGKSILAIIVRLIGMCLLLGGIYIAFQVLLEAMDLYKHPDKIQRFAVAIEKGSNIDSSLYTFRDTITSDSEDNNSGTIAEYQDSNTTTTRTDTGNIRVSYFLAWVIVMMLLMLIGSISLRAIKTGGELVLYDVQIKQFAKMLIKESRNSEH